MTTSREKAAFWILDERFDRGRRWNCRVYAKASFFIRKK
jgi:hypothetical protein